MRSSAVSASISDSANIAWSSTIRTRILRRWLLDPIVRLLVPRRCSTLRTTRGPDLAVRAVRSPVRATARKTLEQRSLSLPDADTERGQPIAGAAPAQLVQQRYDKPRAAHAEWMAERDRTAVHVQLLLVEPELASDHEALRRERLVELHEIEVADTDTRAVEELAHRRDRRDSHHAWIHADDSAADERAERLHAERARLLLACNHERGGAVVDPARVSHRHRPACAECRLQRRELLGARVGTRMLVTVDAVDGDELVAQSRLTVTPATDCGRPASNAAMRATLRLSSPARFAHPNHTSSI